MNRNLGTPLRMKALLSLRPGAVWSWLDSDNYETLDWQDRTATKPALKAIDAEAERLAALPELPPKGEAERLLDAMVAEGLVPANKQSAVANRLKSF